MKKNNICWYCQEKNTKNGENELIQFQGKLFHLNCQKVYVRICKFKSIKKKKTYYSYGKKGISTEAQKEFKKILNKIND